MSKYSNLSSPANACISTLSVASGALIGAGFVAKKGGSRKEISQGALQGTVSVVTAMGARYGTEVAIDSLATSYGYSPEELESLYWVKEATGTVVSVGATHLARRIVFRNPLDWNNFKRSLLYSGVSLVTAGVWDVTVGGYSLVADFVAKPVASIGASITATKVVIGDDVFFDAPEATDEQIAMANSGDTDLPVDNSQDVVNDPQTVTATNNVGNRRLLGIDSDNRLGGKLEDDAISIARDAGDAFQSKPTGAPAAVKYFEVVVTYDGTSHEVKNLAAADPAALETLRNGLSDLGECANIEVTEVSAPSIGTHIQDLDSTVSNNSTGNPLRTAPFSVIGSTTTGENPLITLVSCDDTGCDAKSTLYIDPNASKEEHLRTFMRLLGLKPSTEGTDVNAPLRSILVPATGDTASITDDVKVPVNPGDRVTLMLADDAASQINHGTTTAPVSHQMSTDTERGIQLERVNGVLELDHEAEGTQTATYKGSNNPFVELREAKTAAVGDRVAIFPEDSSFGSVELSTNSTAIHVIGPDTDTTYTQNGNASHTVEGGAGNDGFYDFQEGTVIDGNNGDDTFVDCHGENYLGAGDDTAIRSANLHTGSGNNQIVDPVNKVVLTGDGTTSINSTNSKDPITIHLTPVAGEATLTGHTNGAGTVIDGSQCTSNAYCEESSSPSGHATTHCDQSILKVDDDCASIGMVALQPTTSSQPTTAQSTTTTTAQPTTAQSTTTTAQPTTAQSTTTTTAQPTTTVDSSSGSNSNSGSGVGPTSSDGPEIGGWGWAGIILGVVVFVGAVAGGIWYFRRDNNALPDEEASKANPTHNDGNPPQERRQDRTRHVAGEAQDTTAMHANGGARLRRAGAAQDTTAMHANGGARLRRLTADSSTSSSYELVDTDVSDVAIGADPTAPLGGLQHDGAVPHTPATPAHRQVVDEIGFASSTWTDSVSGNGSRSSGRAVVGESTERLSAQSSSGSLIEYFTS